MSLLGKKYPTPIARPMFPFFVAGGVIYFAVWKIQDAMVNSPTYKDDPRNPNRSSNGH